MTVLASVIDPRTPAYLQNRSSMLQRLAAFEAACDAARAGGGEKWVTRHHARGKLLPRERVELLLDQDTPFLELAPTAAWGSDFAVGASVVTGIGVVEGVECVVVATDPTVDGGAVNPYTEDKICRAIRIATINRLPLINLVESVGGPAARSSGRTGEPHGPGSAPGEPLAQALVALTAARVPTVCVVFGETVGDAAYLPALSDFTIMVRGHARLSTAYLQAAGPVANGRAVNDLRDPLAAGADRLGGWADRSVTDLASPADQLAEDERDALRLARQCVRRFNWRKLGPGPRTTAPPAPGHDPEDLLTVVDADPASAFEPRELLARVLDDSDFDEFKPTFGPALVAGWGQLHGYPVAVLASTGARFGAAETHKAVHLIQLADNAATPLLFVQHAAGPDETSDGADEPGAPLARSVAASTVPHLVVTTGATAYDVGAQLPARAREPRFAFRWPAQQPHPDLPPDDGVIDPRDTRTVLGLCLSAIHSAAVEGAGTAGASRP
ncbi:MAG TPA: carboxyl transferase domain-containing protein [Actinoplanes sp.]|nr:carboxyl transferase domain-containing protein [Actinoplanes sp.]